MNSMFKSITGRVISFMTTSKNLLLEKVPPGGGKTTNTLKTLEEEGFQWIYLAPFHRVIEENLELSKFYNYNYIHLQSRAKLCIIPHYKELASGNPARGIPSIDIRPICENSCPLRETTCPYYETKRQLFTNPINWAGVHHHLKEFLVDFFSLEVDETPLREYYDVMVIDENPIQVLFDTEVANSESLAQLRDMIDNLGLSHKHVNRVNNLIDYLILNFVGNEDLDYPELIQYFENTDFKGVYDEYQEILVEELCLNRIQPSHIPTDYLSIFNLISKKITPENAPYSVVKKLASQYNNKKYQFMAFDNSALLKCPIKIIGLDGTANVSIWESITDRRASVLDRKYVYDKIYQLRVTGNPSKNSAHYARYPLSSWIRNGELSSTGKRLISLINSICKEKNHTVLIACTKTLQPYVEKNVAVDNVMYCNYYYIRSRNEFYEECDTIILACEPNVEEFQVECFSQLSGWSQDVWRQVFTQEEMIQTVGRIRESLDVTEGNRIRDEREVYIFPYTPPTNDINDKRPLFPESTLCTYNDVLMQRKSLENKVLNLIKQNGKAHQKTIVKNFNISRSRVKDILRRLEKRGDIIDGGRKGYYPNIEEA